VVGQVQPMRRLLRDAGEVREGLLPTTLYRDYAISQDLFHWESQSTTGDTSPTGQRYISHQHEGSHVLLFVREYRTSRFGTTMPYMALRQGNDEPAAPP
jgi:Domain of unknown function (DUF3427)